MQDNLVDPLANQDIQNDPLLQNMQSSPVTQEEAQRLTERELSPAEKARMDEIFKMGLPGEDEPQEQVNIPLRLGEKLETVETPTIDVKGTYKQKPKAALVPKMEVTTSEGIAKVYDPEQEIQKLETKSQAYAQRAQQIEDQALSDLEEVQYLKNEATTAGQQAIAERESEALKQIQDIEAQSIEALDRSEKETKSIIDQLKLERKDLVQNDNNFLKALGVFFMSYANRLRGLPDNSLEMMEKMTTGRIKAYDKAIVDAAKAGNDRAKLILDNAEKRKNFALNVGKQSQAVINKQIDLALQRTKKPAEIMKLTELKNKIAQTQANFETEIVKTELSAKQKKAETRIKEGSAIKPGTIVKSTDLESKIDRERYVALPTREDVGYLAYQGIKGKDITEAWGQTQDALGIIKEMKNLVKGSDALDKAFQRTKKGAQFSTLGAILIGSITKGDSALYNAGVISPGELDFIEKLAPTEMKFFFNKDFQKLDVVEQQLKAKLASKLKSSGIPPRVEFFIPMMMPKFNPMTKGKNK